VLRGKDTSKKFFISYLYLF